MSKATFGKVRQNQPIRNNGGTIIYGLNTDGVVTQSFGTDLLAVHDGASTNSKVSNSSLITKDSFIDYVTGKYIGDIYIQRDLFVMHPNSFSSAFSADFS